MAKIPEKQVPYHIAFQTSQYTYNYNNYESLQYPRCSYILTSIFSLIVPSNRSVSTS